MPLFELSIMIIGIFLVIMLMVTFSNNTNKDKFKFVHAWPTVFMLYYILGSLWLITKMLTW